MQKISPARILRRKARPRRPPRACGQRSRCRSCPDAPAAGRSHNTAGARRAGNFHSRRSRGKTAPAPCGAGTPRRPDRETRRGRAFGSPGSRY